MGDKHVTENLYAYSKSAMSKCIRWVAYSSFNSLRLYYNVRRLLNEILLTFVWSAKKQNLEWAYRYSNVTIIYQTQKQDVYKNK